MAKPTDFRLYTHGEFAGSVEVASMFMPADWSRNLQRNGLIEDALNRAIVPDQWNVGFHVRQWNSQRQPSLKPIIGWVLEQIAGLREPSPQPVAAFHHRQYRDKHQGVYVEFSFIQRVSASNPKPSERVVLSYIGGFGGATLRLRTVLDKKVSKQYDLQDSPFAIVVSNHDFSCYLEDVMQAVYGDGGFFSSRNASRIVNTRVSAVYVLHRWAPWHKQPSQAFELVNPNAQRPLRETMIPGSTTLQPDSAVCRLV